MGDTEDYYELPVIARLPVGTHMPEFRDEPEFFLGHAHSDDDNTLDSIVRLRESDRGDNGEEPEGEGLSELALAAIAAGAGAILTAVAIKAYPRVKGWFVNTVTPAWRARFMKEAFEQEVDDAEKPVASQEVSAEVADEQQVVLTPEEAAQHLLDLLIAAANVAAEYRLLSNAHLADPVQHAELENALASFTAVDVVEHINKLLEAEADDEVMSDIARLFSSDSPERLRLSVDSVAEALRLEP